jgi:sortase A
MSSMLRGIQRLLLWAGVAALAYAGGTTAYSEAFQRYESRKFEQSVRSQLKGPEEARDLHEGDVVGKLEVPRIGLSVIVLQGIEESTLLLGAGHVPGTPLPAVPGNVVIAAHRDTFFRKLNVIASGDRIRLSVGTRTYEYIVDSMEIVDPENPQIMQSRDYSELTLITCYPFYYVGNAPKRFIVRARPSTNSPPGSGGVAARSADGAVD